MTKLRCAEASEAWDLIGPEGLKIRVLGLGATWVSCRVPLAGGDREVLLGFASEADYLRQKSYLGATIGRYANRIADARLHWQGRDIQLERSPGSAHLLHGGPQGFDRRRWRMCEHRDPLLRLSLHSAAGDQGFPGALDAEVSYRMLARHAVEIRFQAQVSAPCPVNLSNHAYFNLDGGGDARRQSLSIRANHYLPVDAQGIPTAPLCALAGRDCDFQASRTVRGIYDHAFLLDAGCADLCLRAAQLRASDQRVHLDIHTSLPALQLYTGQFLAEGTRDCAEPWPDCSGIALEPQFLPDSPNHPEWPQPSCWLLPGQRYDHRIVYRFTTRATGSASHSVVADP